MATSLLIEQNATAGTDPRVHLFGARWRVHQLTIRDVLASKVEPASVGNILVDSHEGWLTYTGRRLPIAVGSAVPSDPASAAFGGPLGAPATHAQLAVIFGQLQPADAEPNDPVELPEDML